MSHLWPIQVTEEIMISLYEATRLIVLISNSGIKIVSVVDSLNLPSFAFSRRNKLSILESRDAIVNTVSV